MKFKLFDLEFNLEKLSDQECKAVNGGGNELKLLPAPPAPPTALPAPPLMKSTPTSLRQLHLKFEGSAVLGNRIS